MFAKPDVVKGIADAPPAIPAGARDDKAGAKLARERTLSFLGEQL